MSRRRLHHYLPYLVLGFGLAAAPSVVRAQDPPAGPPMPPTELVFEREVFAYPSFPRRNPFQALAASGEGGPRIEQVRLMGIIFSEEPGSRVAILGTSTVTTSEDGSSVTVSPDGNAWYLKQGQSIGNIRIVEILSDRIVVEVAEFGLTEQRIMQLQTRRTGGPE